MNKKEAHSSKGSRRNEIPPLEVGTWSGARRLHWLLASSAKKEHTSRTDGEAHKPFDEHASEDAVKWLKVDGIGGNGLLDRERE
jgi:hypothetical protein